MAVTPMGMRLQICPSFFAPFHLQLEGYIYVYIYIYIPLKGAATAAQTG
jgi:hypothetical protein